MRRLGIFLLLCFPEAARPQDPLPPPASVSTLKESPLRETAVLPSFSDPLPAGKNAVWCATFQMAWDRLKSDVVKEPVLVSGAETLAGRLNATPFTVDALPPGTFYATAGKAEEGIVERIRKELKGLYPDYTPNLEDARGAGIVAYAYLRAGVPFKVPYFEARQPLAFRDGAGNAHPVHAFGIRIEDAYAFGKLRAQPEILHAGPVEERGQGFREGYGQVLREFVLDPDRESSPFQMILAKVPRKETFKETWKDVAARMAAKKDPEHGHPRIGINEVFLAPNVRLATTHAFRELEGKKLLNKGREDVQIQAAHQTIRFVLNRGGAELESEARILLTPLPRYFVVDGPFLLVLRKRGAADPFFALWIETPELLEAWPAK